MRCDTRTSLERKWKRRQTLMNTVGDPGGIRTRHLLYRSHQRSCTADGAAVGLVHFVILPLQLDTEVKYVAL